jgi:hypothetical protein
MSNQEVKDHLAVKTPFVEIGVTGQFTILVGLQLLLGCLVIFHAHVAAEDQNDIVRNQHLIMDRQRIIINSFLNCPGNQWMKPQFEETEAEREALKKRREERKGKKLGGLSGGG